MRCAIILQGLCLAATVVGSAALAHDQIPGRLPDGPVAIHGGTIHPVDGPVIDQGVVLVEAGKIVAVGKDVKIPEAAERIDAAGMHVYPGMIDAFSDIGLREISAVRATIDRAETGRINPNVRSWVAFNPDSQLIPVTRSGGVLTSLVAPGGPWVRGQAGVMRLDGWSWQDMLLHGPAALVVDWDAMEPQSGKLEERAKRRAERYQEFETLLESARRYAEGRAADPERYPTDLRLESLLPLVQGEMPLIAECDRAETITAAAAFAAAQGLRLIIYGGHDAEACAPLLLRQSIPVILPGTFRLPLRRDDPYDAPYTLPQRLQRAGIPFCIANERAGYPSGAANARNLPHHAGNAVAYGLDEATALRSITLSAAEILGVDAHIGSLTAGKEATLIVVDGDLLEVESNVQYAMIAGRPVDLGNKQRSLYRKYDEKYQRLEAAEEE